MSQRCLYIDVEHDLTGQVLRVVADPDRSFVYVFKAVSDAWGLKPENTMFVTKKYERLYARKSPKQCGWPGSNRSDQIDDAKVIRIRMLCVG